MGFFGPAWPYSRAKNLRPPVFFYPFFNPADHEARPGFIPRRRWPSRRARPLALHPPPPPPPPLPPPAGSHGLVASHKLETRGVSNSLLHPPATSQTFQPCPRSVAPLPQVGGGGGGAASPRIYRTGAGSSYVPLGDRPVPYYFSNFCSIKVVRVR